MSTPGVTPASTEPALRGRLRRADKIMSMAEVDAFLAGAFCGRTATVGADGYPYVVPNLFVWLRGQVYLHTAKVDGHFLANVRHADRISFEADQAGEVFPYGPVECDTSVSYQSVIVFGRIRIIESDAEKIEFYSTFMAKYAPAESWGRERGSFPRRDKTIVYAITPEAITGKQGPLPLLAERWPNKRPAAAAPSAPPAPSASPAAAAPSAPPAPSASPAAVAPSALAAPSASPAAVAPSALPAPSASPAAVALSALSTSPAAATPSVLPAPPAGSPVGRQ